MTKILDEVKPDLLHAMRLPYEGFLASASSKTAPLLISIWGNDFTIFADRNRVLSNMTNAALRRADGLHCDCRRDLNAAFARGFSPDKPWRVLPGNGGIQTNIYFQIRPNQLLLREFGIPEGVPLVVNPRGLRAYVRNDTFFRAIPRVLKEVPNAFFVATGMAGNPTAERWIQRLKIEESVRLLPTISREQLAALFAASQISISPSSHDGTPNSLLEAIACGCFPIVGDVTSLREWIVDGKNGFICDESNANALAKCIIRALRDETLRKLAAEINRTLICTRADYDKGMAEAESLYDEIVRTASRKRSAQPS
jgi:glycosyltransferase involved in cell wall biosynthesis